MKKLGICLSVCLTWFIPWIQLAHGGMYPDKYGVVTPDDPFIYTGQILSLLCNITTNHISAESGQMIFKKGNILLDTKYIRNLGGQSIRLERPVTSLQDEGMYTCYLSGREMFLLGLQKVRVEYPLEAVASVECRVINLESELVCSWTTIPYHHNDIIQSRLSFKIEYPNSVGGHGEWQSCLNSSKNSCFWQREEFLFEFKIGIIITTTNSVTGDLVKSQQFTIIPKDSVQPDSVSDLQVAKLNSSCLTLVWNINTDDFYEYVSQVQMISQWDEQIQKFITEEKAMTTCQMIPHTRYTINITRRVIDSEIKNTTIGWWSPPKIIQVTTHEAAPLLVPVSCTGCFSFSDDGLVTLYFQTLKTQDWYGTERQYMAIVMNMTTNKTKIFFKSSSSNSFTLPVFEAKHAISVKIHTKNRVGVSKNFTHFYIPEMKKAPGLPNNMVVEMVNQTDILNTYHFTSLLNGEYVHYTVYWCEDSLKNTQCMGEVLWQELGTQHKDYYIEIPHNPSHQPFIGISIEHQDGSGHVVSSGIHWQHCVYTASKDPQPPQKVHFLDHQLPNSLVLAWVKPSCAKTASISHLMLTYCKVDDDEAFGNCSQSPIVENVTNDVVSYLINNLDGGSKYKVFLQSVSQNRISPKSNHISRTVKEMDNSGTGYILYVIFIPVIFVLFALILIFYWKTCIRCNKFEPTYPEGFDLKDPQENYWPTASLSLEKEPFLTKDNSSQFAPISKYQNTSNNDNKIQYANEVGADTKQLETIQDNSQKSESYAHSEFVMDLDNSRESKGQQLEMVSVHLDTKEKHADITKDCQPSTSIQASSHLFNTSEIEHSKPYISFNSYSKFDVDSGESESDTNISGTDEEEDHSLFQDLSEDVFVDGSKGQQLEMVSIHLDTKVKQGDTTKDCQPSTSIQASSHLFNTSEIEHSKPYIPFNSYSKFDVDSGESESDTNISGTDEEEDHSLLQDLSEDLFVDGSKGQQLEMVSIHLDTKVKQGDTTKDCQLSTSIQASSHLFNTSEIEHSKPYIPFNSYSKFDVDSGESESDTNISGTDEEEDHSLFQDLSEDLFVDGSKGQQLEMVSIHLDTKVKQGDTTKDCQPSTSIQPSSHLFNTSEIEHSKPNIPFNSYSKFDVGLGTSGE